MTEDILQTQPGDAIAPGASSTNDAPTLPRPLTRAEKRALEDVAMTNFIESINTESDLAALASSVDREIERLREEQRRAEEARARAEASRREAAQASAERARNLLPPALRDLMVVEELIEAELAHSWARNVLIRGSAEFAPLLLSLRLNDGEWVMNGDFAFTVGCPVCDPDSGELKWEFRPDWSTLENALLKARLNARKAQEMESKP